MLSNFFGIFNWTRDDAKWTYGIIAAIVLGLAALGNAITDYGIPATWLPYMRLAALIVGIISAKMATSGLPGARLILIGMLTIASGLGLSACTKPHTPGSADPLLAIRADAKVAIDSLNAASVIGVTALNAARAIPQVSPATVTKIADAVRAYNCALLDEGNTAPMPTGGTVTDACHAHHNPMLGILSRISDAGSADTLHALALQGLGLADQALGAISTSGHPDLAKYVTVAQATLATIRSWS
jgi:hypothetical protein